MSNDVYEQIPVMENLVGHDGTKYDSYYVREV